MNRVVDYTCDGVPGRIRGKNETYNYLIQISISLVANVQDSTYYLAFLAAMSLLYKLGSVFCSG